MSNWQPIETAPKDKTPILIYPGSWKDEWCDIATFNDDKYSKKPKPYWQRRGVHGVNMSRNNPPTKWAPLPKPD